MEEQLRPLYQHRKRKRRRRADRTPLSGWLKSVDHLKGNTGVISSDFFEKLFHNRASRQGQENWSGEIRHIAIRPWSPLSRDPISGSSWNLLPVRSQTAKEEEALKLETASIHFPVSSLALRSFAQTLQKDAGGKSKGKPGFEVNVLEVEPLKLDTVFVDVDGDLLDKHDEVQRRFGGGFPSARVNGATSKGKGRARADSHEDVNGLAKPSPAQLQDDRLTLAVREALASSVIIRQNDLLILPLPAHPITHVSFPPSKITLCEPVNQGILSDTTRIIVNRIRHSDPAKKTLPSLAANKAFRVLQAQNGDDTSNEHFYSAAECSERDGRKDQSEDENSSDNESSDRESGSSSDESLGEIISMKAPSIPTPASGALSSRTAATPRPGWPKRNGISTPGSVFSNFTTTTARHTSSGKSRTFRARGLMGKLTDDMLHPKPILDEDDEARVFVDIKALLKLGCFSGDWVRVQATSPPQTLPSGVWGFETPSEGEVHEVFKPAKIYGLPDLQSAQTPRYARGKPQERRSSVLTAPDLHQLNPAAWLSPILLANLGQPSSVDICALVNPFAGEPTSKPSHKMSKVNSTASPPLAKELTLLRVATPISTERALQTGLFIVLKRHFETKRRILQRGDLIALPIDVNASRLLSPPSTTSDADPDVEHLLGATTNSESSSQNTPLSVAWFKVGQIVSQDADPESSLSPSLWGGAASIEPMTTRMRQIGSEQCRLPSTIGSPWEYYLDVKPPSKKGSAENPTSHLTAIAFTPYVTPLRRRLRELMAAATSPRALHLGMGPIVICLHSTQRNIGKATMASQAASDLGIHVFEIDAFDILAEGAGGGDVKTEAFLKARIDRALSCGPACTAVLLRHVEVFTADRMVTALKEVIKDIRILIATTTEIEKVPDGVRSIFTHELESVAPDEGEREGILQTIVQDRAIELAKNVDMASIAVKTAALVAGNLVDIVDRASVARQERLEFLVMKQMADQDGATLLFRDLLLSGGDFARCVAKADFEIAVEAARKNFADAIGAPKIPNVSWDDVGGLENVKEAVMETIQLPLERPELFAKGMKKRSGILFYGPPGTGKTLLAKAIATEFSLNFFSVKGPELLNMYIGESEANVRRVFQRARDARPCVVFFDELDSVAPKRGNQGDSGGVMDRIVSQLLAELDGMSDGEEGGGGVFVIGATNRPDLLDQALLRPGRFDKMLYLGVSDTHVKQLTILEALTRKFTLHPEMSLRRVADSLPFTYTGADLYALCSDAMLKAITRQASAVDVKIKALPGGPVTTAYFFDHLSKEEDVAVMVTEQDFGEANKELVGSVS